MEKLPSNLQAFAAYKQFMLYQLVPDESRPGKTHKFPMNLNLEIVDAHESQYWVDHELACKTANMLGDDYGVAFVFSEWDPFFFFDIDDCVLNGGWSPIAQELMARMTGAAVEVSQSGTGLHIFGVGKPTVPSAQRRKKDHTGRLFDLYTEGRFVALTGLNMVGDASFQVPQEQLDYLVEVHLKKILHTLSEEWTTQPVAAWAGPEDDDELIKRMLASNSSNAAFGSAVSVQDLWNNNDTKFAEAYPSDSGNSPYDRSAVDAALAQHLAFWTGSNMQRMLDLLWKSSLAREKWHDREGYYLEKTIEHAVSLQDNFYHRPEVDDTIAQTHGGVKLKASSDSQRDFGTSVRAQKLLECEGDEEAILTLCKIPMARFWIDNKDETVENILAKIKVVEHAADPLGDKDGGPLVVQGFQYLGSSAQIEHFKGCTYIIEVHRVLTPQGTLLKTEQFNATYGGYIFQLNDAGDKTTKKAWEAFTESQIVRYPKAQSVCFKPDMEPGALVEKDGRTLVNTYVPVEVPTAQGDIQPFLDHLAKILPDVNDQHILLSYMAACVQHKGVKFQWAPLLQGVEGNGKTLFTRCVAAALGERYTHFPRADEIAEKFNSWLFDKLFIGVEDIYVPEHKKEILEVLKPMITNDRLACRAMQQDQVMRDVCANFILNSNHKNAIRKTRTDRRFAVFYTAQQEDGDLERDGMTGGYFPKLYAWLKREGYARITYYLKNLEIPAKWNPAGQEAHRAPRTSTTEQAIHASLGGIEQAVLEAISEERPGFAGGWVSSVALEYLLSSLRATRAIPHNKRRELLQSLGYDYHPALREGRTNVKVARDDNKKPRLFILKGHISEQLATAPAATEAYIKAQSAVSGSLGLANEVFK